MAKKEIENEYLKQAKALGFTIPSKNSIIKNAYLRLKNNESVILLTGGLYALVSTDDYFNGPHTKRWKSSDKNKPSATMTSTQPDIDGKGTHTEIYYREICKSLIEDTAKFYRCKPEEVYVDHINHIRGDNRYCNLQVATPFQNSLNRSKTKIEKAFYDINDVLCKFATGEWVPED